MTASDTTFFRDCVAAAPTTPPPPRISDWIQGRRILPDNTPFPGPWDNARTPYFVDIMDDLSPYSPVQHVVLMKSRKVGATTMSENVVGYWMDANPTEIEYVTATEDLALDWATRKIPPLIDSLGMRDKITSSSENPKNGPKGDRTFTKEYIGGALDIISARSMQAKRAGDKRILIRDEIDGVPTLTTTGEGNWLKVNEGHTISWGPRKKIFDFSSPTTIEASNIWPSYELGDCRKYYVPCPHCGEMQELEFGNETTEWGLKAQIEGGALVQAYYVCKNPECRAQPHGGKILNYMKGDMLARGHWRPTKKSSAPTLRSYHLSALYSPVGMMSWTELYEEYQSAIKVGPDGMRSFANLYLGLPYAETGVRPKLEVLLGLKGDYARGTVPDDVLYLTAGGDVQDGSGMDPNDPTKFKDPTNPPRIELEILGTGSSYKTWSIDYLRFEGDVSDPFSGAFEKLYQYIIGGGMTYPRLSDGLGLTVQLFFIDSGSGSHSDTVYRFAERINNTFAIKGLAALKADPHRARAENEGPKEIWYRHADIGGPRGIYEINTRHYKRILYSNLNRVKREAVGPQRAGFCDFPRDYEPHYFDMLGAEEQLTDGSFESHGRRNEALDCRVYATCAADVYLDGTIEILRRWAIKNGSTAERARSVIDSKFALTEIAKRIAPKKKTDPGKETNPGSAAPEAHQSTT